MQGKMVIREGMVEIGSIRLFRCNRVETVSIRLLCYLQVYIPVTV